MPVTFPLKESDTIGPCEADTNHLDVFACNYTEDLLGGFPFYEDLEVQFPFGHGLSYTAFHHELQELVHGDRCDAALCVAVELTNTGSVPGHEVVQLYLVFPAGLGMECFEVFRKSFCKQRAHRKLC